MQKNKQVEHEDHPEPKQPSPSPKQRMLMESTIKKTQSSLKKKHKPKWASIHQNRSLLLYLWFTYDKTYIWAPYGSLYSKVGMEGLIA
jgi:hypothetical protein